MIKTVGIESNFLGIEEDYSAFENSKVIILPVPYERTVSYGGGTKDGPQAILQASRYVEFFDEETKREIHRELGIATLEHLDVASHSDESALEMIYEKVTDLIEKKKFVVMLGGEHTITQASLAAFAERYRDLSVLHIDAHADLRAEYQGSKYSHASVMSRVCEFLDPRRIVQVGIRALSIEESEFIEANGITTLYMHEIRSAKYTKLFKYWYDYPIEKLTDHVYVTFDIDGLDPSIMPATGTPEPSGLQWVEIMSLLKKLGKRKKVVGCDLVEFAPIKEFHYPNITAAKIVLKMINYFL